MTVTIAKGAQFRTASSINFRYLGDGLTFSLDPATVMEYRSRPDGPEQLGDSDFKCQATSLPGT